MKPIEQMIDEYIDSTEALRASFEDLPSMTKLGIRITMIGFGHAVRQESLKAPPPGAAGLSSSEIMAESAKFAAAIEAEERKKQ